MAKELALWAEQAGIKPPKLAAATFQGLRGMAALEEIQPQESFVTMPVSATLFVTPRMRCPFPDFVSADLWSQASPYVKLALLLLHAKQQGPASPFAAYINQLPRSFDTPVFWPEEAVRQLQYPHLEAEVAEQRRAWQAASDELESATPGSSISRDELFWALSCVRSRCFSGPYTGSSLKSKAKVAVVLLVLSAALTRFHVPIEQIVNGGVAAALFNLIYDVLLSRQLKWFALLPLIDSMNHKSTAQGEVAREYFTDAIVAVSGKHYKKGEQVFISYGEQGNDRLLQFYGFVERGNPHDAFVLRGLDQRLAADCGVPAAQLASRMAALNEAGLADTLQQAVLTRAGPDPKLLQALRLLLASQGPSAASAGGALEGQGETRVYEALRSALEGERLRHSSSLQQDEAALAKSSRLLGERDRLALQFRVEKKRLLADCVGQADKRLKGLRSKAGGP
ncbi:hypothetical protein WJX72_011353 [[Myrmecia] bisecta]|uniref:Rubisco LSMT substrate-binding domain-containing protein n=1 Tax=[Myrmecia] bisecta TaxID=41462 RepID=A0AAW1P107_9CHLO